MKQQISTVAGLILGTLAAIALTDARADRGYVSHAVAAPAMVEKVAVTSSGGARVVPSTRP